MRSTHYIVLAWPEWPDLIYGSDVGAPLVQDSGQLLLELCINQLPSSNKVCRARIVVGPSAGRIKVIGSSTGIPDKEAISRLSCKYG